MGEGVEDKMGMALRGWLVEMQVMEHRGGHLVTNLLPSMCKCCKCAAVASLYHPPIACRSPDP